MDQFACHVYLRDAQADGSLYVLFGNAGAPMQDQGYRDSRMRFGQEPELEMLISLVEPVRVADRNCEHVYGRLRYVRGRLARIGVRGCAAALGGRFIGFPDLADFPFGATGPCIGMSTTRSTEV